MQYFANNTSYSNKVASLRATSPTLIRRIVLAPLMAIVSRGEVTQTVMARVSCQRPCLKLVALVQTRSGGMSSWLYYRAWEVTHGYFLRPGTLQWEGSFVSEQECTSIGYCASKFTFTTEADCLSDAFNYCEGCSVCGSQQICESQGTCDSHIGCHLPFNAEGDCSLTSDIWTPNGCWREPIGSTVACNSLGGYAALVQ